MLKKLRKKIENKRGSKNLFWKSIVFGKDFAYNIFNACLFLDRIRTHSFIKNFVKNPIMCMDCYITGIGNGDEAGAQIQAVLSTILFAGEIGITYIHTPFEKINYKKENHIAKKKNEELCSEGNDDKEKYNKKWESFLNLGFNELNITDIDVNKLNVIQISPQKIFKIKRKHNTLYIIEHCHSFADNSPEKYSNLQEKFISKYNISLKNTNLFKDPPNLNIAIHIRRGDVQPDSSCERYTPNSFILQVIKEITSVLDDLGIDAAFHIYSQGNKELFYNFYSKKIKLHLDEDIFSTFHDLVTADILVMAKSSFSYSAALFSKGIKIYEPCWHKPLKNWVVINKHGGFSKEKLKQLIKCSKN